MTKEENALTYIDLFAGCGGLSLGLFNSGWKGLFAIEKSPDAFQTLKYNLIEKKKHFDWPTWLEQTNHDINAVLKKHKDELEKLQGHVDLVVGGPPCQGFSTAGRRKEDDVRNGLIKSYLNFVKIVKPNIIFFENVKGFTLKFHKNKSKGRVYSNYVVNELNKLGYDVDGKLVDFSMYGIPQKRTRFILVGIKKDLITNDNISSKSFFKLLISNRRQFLIDKNLPFNPYLKNALSDLLKKNGLVKTPDRKGFKSGKYSKVESRYQEFLRAGSDSKTPNSHSFPKHKKEIKKRFKELLKSEVENKNISDEARKKHKIKKHTLIPLGANKKSPTITTLPDDYIHYCEPRILTVRECARIQSFPDWYEFKSKYTTGGERRKIDVPRYTQVGNAIPPLFGEQVGLVIKGIVALDG
ncbi:MAG: DNA cytosine methyltransferase [Ignavibacteriales bacterium]|nr:MAG: DNA cytosine methyltransferase [Ignavibacteriales bacterium]